VCGDLNFEKMEGYNAINGAAATQNILLAAHDRGIGAVWLGIYPREERVGELKRILKMPDHIFPISIIALGWPKNKKPPVDRYMEERVQFDTF
jgi:nitroreductase